MHDLSRSVMLRFTSGAPWLHGARVITAAASICCAVISISGIALAQQKYEEVRTDELKVAGRLSFVDVGFQASPFLGGGTARVLDMWFLEESKLGIGLTVASLDNIRWREYEWEIAGRTVVIDFLSPVLLYNLTSNRRHALTIGSRYRYLWWLFGEDESESKRKIPQAVELFGQMDLLFGLKRGAMADTLAASYPVSIELGYRYQHRDFAIGEYGDTANVSGIYLGARVGLGAFFHSIKSRIRRIPVPGPRLHLSLEGGAAEAPSIPMGSEQTVALQVQNLGPGQADNVVVTIQGPVSEGLIEIYPLESRVGHIEPGGIRTAMAKIRNLSQTTYREITLAARASGEDGFSSDPLSFNVALSPEKPAFPAHMVISSKSFAEPNRNMALDAEESGRLVIEVKNEGLGDARLKIRVKPLSDITHLRFEPEVDEGIVKVGESRKVEIPITADIDVETMEREFRVEVIDEYYKSVTPFSFSFSTLAIEPPEFRVILKDYSDDRAIYARNEPDGLIVAGEVVKVVTNIQNVGTGDAEDVRVNVDMSGQGQGINYRRDLQGSLDTEFELGKMASGDDRDVEFYFFPNPDFLGDRVTMNLSVTESRGRYGGTKTLELEIGQSIETDVPLTVTALEMSQEPVRMVESELIDVDDPPTSSKAHLDNGLAVIFGVETYKHTFDAGYKRRDATVFYRYCRDVLGIPEDRIHLVLDDEATKAEFDYVFEPKETERDGWLKKRLRDREAAGETDLIVYIGGHGYPDFAEGHPYFIPYDVRPEQATNGVSLDWLYESLVGCGARSVVVFVEACFCGVSGYRKGMGEEPLLAGMNVVTPMSRIPMSFGDNMVVFLATSGTRPSNNRDDLKHGIFTYYVLKGLGGAGDSDGNGTVTVRELYAYLAREVSKKAYEAPLDREQVPHIIPSLESMSAGLRDKVLVRY